MEAVAWFASGWMSWNAVTIRRRVMFQWHVPDLSESQKQTLVTLALTALFLALAATVCAVRLRAGW